MTEPSTSAGILGLFGVNGKLLLAQLVNFALIVFVMTRWVYRPLLNAMDERAREIEEGRRQAEASKREYERLDRKAKAAEAKAQAQAKSLVDEARRQARALKAQAAQETKAELERLRHDADERRQAEVAAAEAAFRKQAVDLVFEATKNVARRTLDDVSHRALIQEAIAELERP